MNKDYFLRKLEEINKQIINAIVTGNLTQESYRYHAGRLQGLKDAEDLYRDIIKRSNHNDI